VRRSGDIMRWINIASPRRYQGPVVNKPFFALHPAISPRPAKLFHPDAAVDARSCARAGAGRRSCGPWQSNQADTEFHGVGMKLHGKPGSRLEPLWPDASKAVRRPSDMSLLRETRRELRENPCPLDRFATAIANVRIMDAVEHRFRKPDRIAQAFWWASARALFGRFSIHHVRHLFGEILAGEPMGSPEVLARRYPLDRPKGFRAGFIHFYDNKFAHASSMA
jgi:hypothetical protein